MCVQTLGCRRDAYKEELAERCIGKDLQEAASTCMQLWLET